MNIVIWGAGKFGQYIKTQLNSSIKVRYYVDSNKKNWGKRIGEIEIISPEKFTGLEDIDLVLVAFIDSLIYLGDILKVRDIKYGFVNYNVWQYKIILIDDILHDPNITWCELSEIGSFKPILRQLETNIVDYCNLNCKGCSHFSNLFSLGQQITYETYCKDLKQIAKNTLIAQFSMLGGEALLNPNIIEYIEFTRKILPYTYIQLVTNGLLLLKQSEDFFECCKKNNITISISGYKPTLKMKAEIEKKLKEKQVLYKFRIEVEKFGKNIDLTGSADKINSLKNCREKNCHFFRNGKIYKCPFEALGNIFFKYYNIGITIEGGYDIYGEDVDWKKLIKKLDNDHIEACKYCGKEESIDWEIANEPTLKDWVVKQ